jgi:hypothetical protein
LFCEILDVLVDDCLINSKKHLHRQLHLWLLELCRYAIENSAEVSPVVNLSDHAVAWNGVPQLAEKLLHGLGPHVDAVIQNANLALLDILNYLLGIFYC